MSRPLHPCGTPAAYQRHHGRGEQPCEPCLVAHRADQAARRAAQGVTPRPIPACGTPSAYKRHLHRGEIACDPCRQANNDRVRSSARRRRALVATGEPVPERPPLQPCGTMAAYQRHHRKGEPPCEPCRAASRELGRARREAARAARHAEKGTS